MNYEFLFRDKSKEIADFFSANFNDGWSEQMLLSAFDTREFFVLGAFVEKELTGVVTYSLAVDTADIEDIVTKKSQRRKGIGLELLTRAEKAVVEKGVSKIFLEVRETNIPAISLYEKAGYKRLSVRKKYYSDTGEAAVLMTKQI